MKVWQNGLKSRTTVPVMRGLPGPVVMRPTNARHQRLKARRTFVIAGPLAGLERTPDRRGGNFGKIIAAAVRLSNIPFDLKHDCLRWHVCGGGAQGANASSQKQM